MNTTLNNSADGLYGLGYWLLDQERYADAMHVFRTMLLVAPSDDRAWLGLGASHEGAGELDRAARLYALAARACATSARSVIALGRVLRKLDRDDEAELVYSEAAERAAANDDVELAHLIATEARAS